MSFSRGLVKVALFGLCKKKEAPKTYSITEEHVKHMLPHFKKHDRVRKAKNEGKTTPQGADDHDTAFINSVAEVEAATGIPNEHLYTHMYKNHGYDK